MYSRVPLTLFYIFVIVCLDAKYTDHFSAVFLCISCVSVRVLTVAEVAFRMFVMLSLVMASFLKSLF